MKCDTKCAKAYWKSDTIRGKFGVYPKNRGLPLFSQNNNIWFAERNAGLTLILRFPLPGSRRCTISASAVRAAYTGTLTERPLDPGRVFRPMLSIVANDRRSIREYPTCKRTVCICVLESRSDFPQNSAYLYFCELRIHEISYILFGKTHTRTHTHTHSTSANF